MKLKKTQQEGQRILPLNKKDIKTFAKIVFDDENKVGLLCR